MKLKNFQQEIHNTIIYKFKDLKSKYDSLDKTNISDFNKIRKLDGGILLQAPTGCGKTFIASQIVSTFNEIEKMIWFWFAPFSGLIEQTRQVFLKDSVSVPILDIHTDRTLENLKVGGIYFLTWQKVAVSNNEGRKARITGDDGLSIDELMESARMEDYKIGCIIDEAHHSIVSKKTEASKFFSEIVTPDYLLMMTATPNDKDIKTFSEQTGYELKNEKQRASVSREDGVKEGLLKRGVKMVRFLEKNPTDKDLIDMEKTALEECTLLHREIKSKLENLNVPIQPLMLVQVPNGKKESIEEVKNFLTDNLRFKESSVKVHTANEPDENFHLIAHDPKVEVLIFKMAVATGFDAPRAFTLAALRGIRNEQFGVQVVGRIMRIPKEMQFKKNLDDSLYYGYVFIANKEKDEGLLLAADLINRIKTQNASLGSQTVVTIYKGNPKAQVVENGDIIPLIPNEEMGNIFLTPESEQKEKLPKWKQIEPYIPNLTSGNLQNDEEHFQKPSPLTQVLVQEERYVYKIREGVPKVLKTEYMPDPGDNYQERILDFVDFTGKTDAARKKKIEITEEISDIFNKTDIAKLNKKGEIDFEALADKTTQLLLNFVTDRLFKRKLFEHYKKFCEKNGWEISNDEELCKELDLILISHKNLIKDAQRKSMIDKLELKEVYLNLEVVVHNSTVQKSTKNIYGVFPESLNSMELELAKKLDSEEVILWWHRNGQNSKGKEPAIGLNFTIFFMIRKTKR
ncbi:MAG: DEAD/DEAH box helicase family protein [Leptospiraceae bacterium]|nr:DEAD/DEAH box helicase family protein [Leptospiraceae bacterium]